MQRTAAPPLSVPGAYPAPAEDAATIRRAVVACAIGQVFEIFDFVIYGFFAVAIGRAFFPSADPIASLLASFATFAVGFLMRPVGAMVIGWYGDRFGRRKALVITIGLMAFATGCTGLIPSYGLIGVWGAFLLVICRMLQGFSTGGEWGGAAAFLVEHAPSGRRGLIGSLQQAATALGAMGATFSAAILTSTLSAESFFAWGWRIPFLIGFVLGPVGYYLRTRVAETPAFRRAEATRSLTRMPLAEAFTTHGWVFLAAFGLSIIGCVINYVFLVFLPSFASQTLKIDLSHALWSTSLAGVLYLVLTPIVGHYSDRTGRKPMLFACTVLAFVMAYPLFRFLQTYPNFWGLLVVQATAQMVLTLYTGVISTILSEMFPTNVRYTALSVSYGFAVAIFGGFAPYIATSLVHWTGDPLAPSYYVMGAALVSGIAVLFVKERVHETALA
ncbi:MAG TPA: MFS transporter [Acetobacteraceae bacterium]|jgi:MHS family proline/betaine transporter-like MFS transporter|nr:MFS transporter [Acetobacteraceae bacterium]